MTTVWNFLAKEEGQRKGNKETKEQEEESEIDNSLKWKTKENESDGEMKEK